MHEAAWGGRGGASGEEGSLGSQTAAALSSNFRTANQNQRGSSWVERKGQEEKKKILLFNKGSGFVANAHKFWGLPVGGDGEWGRRWQTNTPGKFGGRCVKNKKKQKKTKRTKGPLAQKQECD